MEKKPDFIKMEQDILNFWDKNKTFEKLREKNASAKKFRFLDGPITANNPMGIHHAWGRSIKDIFLRYKAMNGYSCHYRNGFDTQGLWVEVEVEKELGFKDKRDIEAYGMENFTRKCVERIRNFSGLITRQSKRLGQWMDWENSYYTHTDENISAIWHFLKICHENGWITKAHKPMPWCPRCGTSLSEHEMSGSHKEITHTAVFAIAKLQNANFDALVWTTTPWTLSANAALAVNPNLDYALVKCEGFERAIVLAKNAIKHIEGEKQVLKLIKGEELIGCKYEAFFPGFSQTAPQENAEQLPARNKIFHEIIPWDEVDANEGSGIVHIAPGCGAEDYELGKKFSLAEISPLDDSGIFVEGYDFLTGKTASQAAELIFAKLKEQGKLFKTHEYTHSYPVCWRCKTEVLFRLVREWYIQTDEIKPRLIAAAETVKWEPSFIGKRMLDWLNNMGDWNISRKRFYGLPLPFYPCEVCDCLTVIGSKDELISRGNEAALTLPELHRPWVDEIKIKCPQCGAAVSRIPEVGDVWLAAGIVPFSTLGYFNNKQEWERNFPAEWVVEMQEQVRLWFYSMLFMSVTITGKAPYEKVQTNNWVLAEDGTKFSKTGYMIRFDEAAEKMGADAIRYLFAGAPMSSDVRFGFTLGLEARRKLLGFKNIYSFFMTYAPIDKPKIEKAHSTNLTDMWLAARVASFVKKAVKCYEDYNTTELIRDFEHCVDDVSNWYVRVNRKRFWKEGLDVDKQNAYNSLYFAIKTMAQVMAPILPFMGEHIWQNTVRVYENTEESVFLSSFPRACDFDSQILTDTENVRAVIAHALKLRNEQNLKVKQPLSVLYLGKVFEVVKNYEPIVREELNVREIVFLDEFNVLSREYVSLNFQAAGRLLKSDLNKVKVLVENLSQEEHARFAGEIKKGSEMGFVGDVKNEYTVRLPGYEHVIPAECFLVLNKDKENIARAENEIPAAINTEITRELKLEGIYRELLRHCQILRKEAGFSILDRVLLCFKTESEIINSAIHVFRKDIERESLSEIRKAEKYVTKKEIELDDGKVTIFIG